jgi:hypothetical protein
MRRRWLMLGACLVWVSACGKKTPAANSSEAVDYSGGFIEISLDDEDDLDEMFGSELMVATAKCGDLVKLEPSAMMGKLNDGEIRCLDQQLREAERQTVKDKISRVLQSDAWAKGDQHRWEGIARRHLEEIDRSDPDMCYKFSLYLSKKGPDFMDEAMRWADVALENRSRWSGDLHVKRVYALYRLKAMAAQKKWQHLEQKYVEEPSEENLQVKDETRNLTKTLSREWLEYAREANKDPTVALQLCISAAGTTEFCEGT